LWGFVFWGGYKVRHFVLGWLYANIHEKYQYEFGIKMSKSWNKQLASFVLIWQTIPRPIRRILVLVPGLILLLGGLVMLVTPGPGIALIILGLTVLASEFLFARKIKDYLMQHIKSLADEAKKRLRKS
jgi:hypothetical protein